MGVGWFGRVACNIAQWNQCPQAIWVPLQALPTASYPSIIRRQHFCKHAEKERCLKEFLFILMDQFGQVGAALLEVIYLGDEQT